MTQPPEFVLDFFKQQRDLFFVDIGANDGVCWSNTFELEKKYGWRGVCIEPHPTMFSSLTAARDCTCLNIAVSDTDEILDFFVIEGTWEANMLSGLIKNYDPRHWDRVTEEYKRYNGSANTIKIKTKPLRVILDTLDIKKVDYLSIDTEGSEIPILRSIDLDKTEVTLISVEQNYERDPLDKILSQYGYNFIGKVACDAFYTK